MRRKTRLLILSWCWLRSWRWCSCHLWWRRCWRRLSGLWISKERLTTTMKFTIRSQEAIWGSGRSRSGTTQLIRSRSLRRRCSISCQIQRIRWRASWRFAGSMKISCRCSTPMRLRISSKLLTGECTSTSPNSQSTILRSNKTTWKK